MQVRTALLVSTLLLVGTALSPASARAADVRGAVFTMTNSAVRGNEVVAYERAADGSLRFLGAFPAGGRGAGPAPTSTVFGAKIPATADGLGSQDSLILTEDRRFLFAVNAGSNSVACFRVDAEGPGALLGPARTVGSGGVFPVSLTFRGGGGGGGVLYVLNAGNQGNITGFRVGADCGMTRIQGGRSGSLSALVDDPPFPSPEPNEVLTTAAQVGFTPDGRRLVVTIKGGPVPGAEGPPEGGVAVFRVDSDGRLDGRPAVTEFSNEDKTAGSFSFLFDDNGNLLINHGNSFTFGSFRIRSSGALAPLDKPVVISPVGDGEVLRFGSFNCWVVRRGNVVYVMSFGDIPATNGGLPDGPGAISALRVGAKGSLELLDIKTGGAKGVVAILPQDDRGGFDPGEEGTFGNHGIDMTVVEDGDRAFLYAVQPRLGKIGAWRINRNGTLRPVGNFDRRLPAGVDPFAGTNPGIGDFLERCFRQRRGDLSPECRDGSAQGMAGF